MERRAAAGATAGVVLALVAGCGTTAAPPAARPAQATVAPARVTADTRACAGVEAILGHVAADTAAWSPTRHPFDRDVARRIRTQAGFLAAQGQQADDAAIRVATDATAASFRGVAAAVRARDRTRLDRAVQRSRVGYRALTSACARAGE